MSAYSMRRNSFSKSYEELMCRRRPTRNATVRSPSISIADPAAVCGQACPPVRASRGTQVTEAGWQRSERATDRALRSPAEHALMLRQMPPGERSAAQAPDMPLRRPGLAQGGETSTQQHSKPAAWSG
jgi:hypothetical protein